MKKNLSIVCVVLWMATFYMHYLDQRKSTTDLENTTLSFNDTRAVLLSNKQNWRAVAGEDQERWSRQTNIRITLDSGEYFDAHCKYVSALCNLLRRNPDARISGQLARVKFEPGAWIFHASNEGMEILSRNKQLLLLQENIDRSRLLLWVMYGIAMTMSFFAMINGKSAVTSRGKS